MVVLAVGIIIAAVYLFREQIFSSSKPKSIPVLSQKAAAGGGNPRDFIAKMKEGVRFSASLLLTYFANGLATSNRKSA